MDRTDQRHDGNVIHVKFGRAGLGGNVGGGLPPPGASLGHVAGTPPEADPVTCTYTRAEVACLFGLTVRRLQAWEHRGIVRPTARAKAHGAAGGAVARAVYSFADLVAVKSVQGLLAAGVAPVRIRRAVEALRRDLPELTQPLTDARVQADGTRLVARRDGTLFEPSTGQLVLDFTVRSLRDDVVRVLRPRGGDQARRAYEHYLEGLRLDEDETTRGRAEEHYRRAIELDPRLATAATNLGNLRLLAGDREEAERLYRRAMVSDPSQAEAPYNLGYLLAEQGRRDDAVGLFTRAIELRPGFAEAHYNLAVALDEAGARALARSHWRRYLELDPRGPWSAVARERVEQP